MAALALEATAQVMAEDATPSLIGRQLGAYEVLSLLGAGGMGEVYRARDTKLNRDVALAHRNDERPIGARGVPPAGKPIEALCDLASHLPEHSSAPVASTVASAAGCQHS